MEDSDHKSHAQDPTAGKRWNKKMQKPGEVDGAKQPLNTEPTLAACLVLAPSLRQRHLGVPSKQPGGPRLAWVRGTPFRTGRLNRSFVETQKRRYTDDGIQKI